MSREKSSRKAWLVPDDQPEPEILNELLNVLYPTAQKDKKQFFMDAKSRLRLQLAHEGCTFSMVSLAKKLFDENPVSDGIAMETAFRWLIRAARAGDEAAVGMLSSKRKHCPASLASFVDEILERGYCERELTAVYAKRIASRFKKIYVSADEKAAANQVQNLISGQVPSSDSLFARCFQDSCGDLFALGVTIAIGGLIGHTFMSSFDHLLSHKLAPAMDAFFAFLCTVLLIFSMNTYCALFTCAMYSKVMRLDAKYRDQPLPYRLMMLWTRTKLQMVSAICVVLVIVLSVVACNRVSLTVFSCTTYLISLADLIKQLHWCYSRRKVPDQYVGWLPLLLKLVSVICVSTMFSFSKAELQDTIITLAMTLVACSILFLWDGGSVFTFTFLTSEYSIILQGLSVLKTIIFIVLRQLFWGVPRHVKTLFLVFLTFYAVVNCVPPGILLHPKDVTTKEIYELCQSTPSFDAMVACGQLEGRALSNANAYIESVRLVSRSNLLESIGVTDWKLNDGFVELGVDSFEKVKVEVKLTIDYISTSVILDDDALDVIRQLKPNEYIRVDGIVEQLRSGPEMRLAVASAVAAGDKRVEIKQLGTAMRLYRKHVLDVLVEWKQRIQAISSAVASQTSPAASKTEL